jgi:hypothetical protein
MSLTSLLLALVPPLAARFKRPDEVARLRAELADAKRELELERQFTAELAQRQAHARLAQHISLLAQYRPQRTQQAQDNAQMAQQGQLAGVVMLNQANQMLGAQNLSSLNDMVCNCVPARHDLLLRD